MTKLPILLRPANETDIPFLFNTWLKSYRNSYFATLIPNPVYFTEHHKIIESLLKDSQVIIACNENDTTQIYGYIVADNSDTALAVHYIYVKQSFRRLGIAKMLLSSLRPDQDTAAVCTHITYVTKPLAPKYNLIYHPYIALSK